MNDALRSDLLLPGCLMVSDCRCTTLFYLVLGVVGTLTFIQYEHKVCDHYSVGNSIFAL